MPKFNVDFSFQVPEDIEVLDLDAVDVDNTSASLLDESVNNISSIQGNKLVRPIGSKAAKRREALDQSSFASATKIAESNDKLAAAL